MIQSKLLSEMNIGDCRLINGDYDFLSVSFFNRVNFEKNEIHAEGAILFGNGSYKTDASYMVTSGDWSCDVVSDEDRDVLMEAYGEFSDSCIGLYNEFINIEGEPLYYISDDELNIPIKDGDIILRKNAKYSESIEILTVWPNDYGNTFNKDIKQDEDFYKWLSRKDDRSMMVTLNGRKIILGRNYCQYQTKNALLICYIGSKEYELYKVNVDMKKLADRIKAVNNKFYNIAKDVYENNGGILKKESVKLDWA